MTDDEGALRPIEGGAPAGVPVFGKRTTPLDRRKYRPFAIEVETDDERFDVPFSAYFDPDAGAILGLMNARTEWQQANATAVLLGTSLRDDDGVSRDWRVPTAPVVDEDAEEDEDGNLPPLLDEEGRELFEWHDGELLTREELNAAIDEFDPLDVGSSRRRFAYVMDSPRHRVQMTALNELAQWLIGDLAKRPTQRPSSSGRGPSRTRRTSGAGSR